MFFWLWRVRNAAIGADSGFTKLQVQWFSIAIESEALSAANGA